MFPIITEKEPIENGKTVYEIFGVKLEPNNQIAEEIDIDGSIFYPWKNPLFKRILNQNDAESMFFRKSANNPVPDFDLWLQTSQEEVDKNNSFFKYFPLAPIHNNNKIYPDVYDKMLETFQCFFDQGELVQSRIYIFRELSRYIKACQKISFKIVRSTEKKTVVDLTNIKAAWIGTSNALLKANTEALMLLLQQVGYIDEEKEVPIVLDGKPRSLVLWNDITSERAANGHFYSTYSSK